MTGFVVIEERCGVHFDVGVLLDSKLAVKVRSEDLCKKYLISGFLACMRYLGRVAAEP